MPAARRTPEQLETQRKRQPAAANRREFARLALGMFGTTTSAFPVEFTYVGQAEAADGKADVLDVRGAGRIRREVLRRREDASAADAELDGQGAAAS